MKTIKIFVLFVFFSMLFVSCSDSNDPSDTATITIISEMPEYSVTSAELLKEINKTMAVKADSLHITRVRVLIKEIKFHPSENDTVNDKSFKVGPFILETDSTGRSFQLTQGELPAGIYDKIKFEIHRFSSSELSQYQTDDFADFATQDRYSVIIEGTKYLGNTSTDFTFNASITANLSLKFDEDYTIDENSTNTFAFQFKPIVAFIKNSGVLDPTENNDRAEIENLIKSAIKALKKAIK